MVPIKTFEEGGQQAPACDPRQLGLCTQLSHFVESNVMLVPSPQRANEKAMM